MFQYYHLELEVPQRFPGLMELNLIVSSVDPSWLKALRAFPKLNSLSLGGLFVEDRMAYRLHDAHMAHLRV